jgi:hypothetical protein
MGLLVVRVGSFWMKISETFKNKYDSPPSGSEVRTARRSSFIPTPFHESRVR